MVVTSGLNDADPQAAYRQDICRFADDRLSVGQKLDFIHRLLGREMAEVRMFLDRIEEYIASLSAIELQSPATAGALDAIAGDRVARARYLDFARDADQLEIRVRMMKLAQRLAWLSPAELRAELMQVIGQQLNRGSVDAADLDVVCALNEGRELDQELHRLHPPPVQTSRTDHAAVLACLGSAEGRARVLEALSDADERGVELAQVYLYRRPITDVNEMRIVSKAIANMQASPAQIRAIDTLARHRLSDRQSLDEMIRLYSQTRMVGVQVAVASVLIRADYRTFSTPELVETLRQNRLKTAHGEDLIDVLIRRLEAP